MRLTFYQVVGVAPTASPEEIRRAYQERAKLIHPDHRFGEPDEVIEQANLEMAALNEAWEVLREPARRAAYDADLLVGTAGSGSASGVRTQARTPGTEPPTARAAQRRASTYRHEADPRYPRRMRLDGECAVCGSVPAIAASFRISDFRMLAGSSSKLWERPYSWKGPFCRECGISIFRDTTNKTLCVGWQRSVPVLGNLLVIVLNLRNFVRVLRLGAPQRYPGVITFASAPLHKSPPLLLRAGPYWSALLGAMYWSVWTFLGAEGVAFALLATIIIGTAVSDFEKRFQ